MQPDEALVIIDYTNDFVAPNGKLTCGEPAQRIDARIAELLDTFMDMHRPVVMARDLHEIDNHHPEQRLFPPHNLKGTHGREVYGKTGERAADWSNWVYWLDKTWYSAFADTNLDSWLRLRGVHHLHLVGVCTDICVQYTGIDAFYRGYRLTVHRDAVASFNPVGHDLALEQFAKVMGAEVLEGWQPSHGQP